ncbi:hypothetical protein IGI04_026976 [Brassica rapa subsp. trilocularis]|uniref:Uncharacterized protein n=1 Tax=Brassica rapa subsp. trilocularis TaxID=1813537 RepID=A0ABQ7KXL7_BRACM|nr:hypothetical protein IGI04_026976 [Brassica rapa subsp. trilocularis]
MPTRPVCLLAPVLHPNMRVNDLINQESQEWDVEWPVHGLIKILGSSQVLKVEDEKEMRHGHLQHRSAGVKGLDEQLREGSTYGNTKLYSARVCHAFRSRSTEMGDVEYASVLVMSKLQNGLQGFDLHD